jgi:TolB-like protein/Tfp pilus assembly protein PilF
VAAAAAVVVLGATAWYLISSPSEPPADATTVRSLAILPLKPLVAGADVDQIGLGVADTVIARIGRIGGVTVRPTSAVRPYVASDVSGLDAARALQVDAIVEGTLHRSGDRLRVNMSLLRVSDGATIWNETYDAPYASIFETEDRIAAGVVSALRLRVSSAEQARLTAHSTSSPEAYENYLKGVATFGSLGAAGQTPVGNVAEGIQWLERAVALDPKYALAYAQLAWAQMWLGTTGGNETAVTRARESLARAEALDSSLPETHLVRYTFLYSAFGGYQILEAAEAAKAAERLQPGAGHFALGSLYAHLGLIDAAERELRRAVEIDPTNLSIRGEWANAYWYSARGNDAIRVNEELGRPVTGWPFLFYVTAGRSEEARDMIDKALTANPDNRAALGGKARLLALEGRHAEARALLPPPTPAERLSRTFHHATYNYACLTALAGNVPEAMKWLDETVKNGMPIHPAFARDTCFEPIRQTSPFITFMNTLKPIWENYERRLQPSAPVRSFP